VNNDPLEVNKTVQGQDVTDFNASTAPHLLAPNQDTTSTYQDDHKAGGEDPAMVADQGDHNGETEQGPIEPQLREGIPRSCKRSPLMAAQGVGIARSRQGVMKPTPIRRSLKPSKPTDLVSPHNSTL
jgi:hypothetical protein